MDEIGQKVVDCETSSNKNKSRLLWDDFTFKQFVDARLLEYRRGNRPGTSFSKVGWANIINTMCEKTGKTFERKQVTNKWDSMKKEWKLYDRLMRLETGIGGTRSFIDASPEWRDEKVKW
ncbi:L10-interacting MYB domain-containing protein-like [Helianthus annuus]|uniref:L10-interacting MYB domain-containing protein-like n=1 Tax=Helianthus annuus TaxID=4232 RepID=UPI000B907B58|nr:L10-interacting MYB domain-containing protein-like [Helianthus annuus]